MPALNPLYLNNWVNFSTTIEAPEVRAEFLNLYGLVNGGLDATNLSDASITTSKLTTEAVTDDKIKSVSANKIVGKISSANLPDGVALLAGGEFTGTFNFTTTLPFIKTYSQTTSTILEAGTGASKLSWTVNPSGDALVIKRGDVVLLTITQDGTLIPRKFKMPGE